MSVNLHPSLLPDIDEAAEQRSADERYEDRNAVEQDALIINADEVRLAYTPWRGKEVIKVPRWTLERLYECEKALKTIAKNLNPKTTLALIQGAPPETAIEDVWALWFDGIGREIVEIVCRTLGLIQDDEKDEWLEWWQTVSPEDTLEVFVKIVHNQITNPRVRAILKKLTALLEETAPSLVQP